MGHDFYQNPSGGYNTSPVYPGQSPTQTSSPDPTWQDFVPGLNTYELAKTAGAGGASLSDLMNTLEGDPAGMASQLQKLSNQAYGQGQQVKNFLLGQENNAEQYYRPMQQMFGSMYGTGGVMPGTAPGVPGSTPFGGGG